MSPHPVPTVESVRVVPIVFDDPPLLNAAGVHRPHALRTVVVLTTSSGATGLGESQGSARQIALIERMADAIVGLPVHAVRRARDAAATVAAAGSDGVHADRAFAPLEVAMVDALGHETGRPVSELLGGRRRDSVEFAGYLFYKWGAHLGPDGGPLPDDEWGEVTEPAALVEQARRMQKEFGFRSWKLKGGVRSPREEVAAVRALADALPGAELRIDPNALWTVDTAVRVADELTGLIDYLEDPVPGPAAMAEVVRRCEVPIASNMLVQRFSDHADVIRDRSADVVLVDHHIAGGLHHAAAAADLTGAAGLGVSMHSNSHLGITLMAMVHLAAVTADVHSCDTHYPWNGRADLVVGGPIAFRDGAVEVPTGPGLGIELDHDLLEAAHERYLASSLRERDDAGYRRLRDPGFTVRPGTWEYDG